MTLFECIQTYLSSSGSLGAKVSGGIHPGYIPQDGTFPLAVVRYVSGVSQRPTHDAGVSPWSQCRIEITFWGGNYKDMEQASGIASKMFQSSTGFYLGGASNGLFSPTQIQGPRDVRDETRNATGIQIDIIGLLNGDTLS